MSLARYLSKLAALVGSDGKVPASALQPEAQSVMFKNRIINGAMMIDQRNAGASVTPAGDSYTLDRWFISGYGTGLNSSSIQRLSSGVVSGFKNYIRMQAGSTSGTNLFLSQSIETNNCYDLAGESITVSFWYRVNTNFTNPCRVLLGSSTSADTKIANVAGTTSSIGTLTNTSTWTKFTGTVTVPSDALTVGVLITNGYNNAINGANIDITGVQLEKGSTATSFDYRPYGAELALCQRYYTKLTSDGAAFASWGNGVANSTSSLQGCVVRLPVPMRTQPSMDFSNIRAYDGSGASAISSVSSVTATSNAYALGFDAACATATLTAMRPATIQGNNTTAAYIAANAEL